MIVGGYTLDLYCDVVGCEARDTFAGHSAGAARAEARRCKWAVRMSKDECFCPDHSGKT